MNAPVRRVAVAVLVLFGVLLANATYLQVVRADDLRSKPGNARVLLREYERQRGPIVVGEAAIARSRATNDRLKYLRTYPGGATYAPVTGFYSLVYGASGIERARNSILSGDADQLALRRLGDLVSGRTAQGGTVLLTLDPRAQRAAFAALRGRLGAVVALDPRTGAILALVSSPSYDPALLSSHDPKAIRANYRRLLTAAGDPMLNRALSRTYPPGSTFKVVTAAAALESGRWRPDSRIPSPTVLDLPKTDKVLRNFGGGSCGGATIPLADALRISCNTAFGWLGMQVGGEALGRQAQAFGFGTPFEIPLPAAASAFPSNAEEPQQAYSGIGQFEVRTTPLQMALVAAGVANRGVVMRPYLVDEEQAPDLSVLDKTAPRELGRATSPRTAAALTAMMRLVVDEGTGAAARIPGVEVAGKTGTAQHGEGQSPHAWFIGFAPADSPRVAVAVVVENGGGLGSEATGGRVAAPIGRLVMQAVLGG